jgi:hypothetical protein
MERSPAKLSTQSRSTPLVFDLRWRPITPISCVWTTFGRSQNLPGRVPRNGFVGAPYPARAEPRRAQAEHSGVAIRSRRFRTSGGGRVEITPEFRCHSGGRPRLGGTPVRARPSPPGATQPAVVPFPPSDCHTYVQDQRNWDISCIFAAHVPILAIMVSRNRIDLELPPLWPFLHRRNGPQPVA